MKLSFVSLVLPLATAATGAVVNVEAKRDAVSFGDFIKQHSNNVRQASNVIRQ